MGRLSSSRVLTVLSVLCSLLQWSHGTDIKIDSYEISNPADPASDVTYNRVTDTSLVFTVTVSSAATGGDVDGIDVYFVDTSDAMIGTAKAAGGSAPTAGSPAVIPATGSVVEALTGNTVDLKFASEADCTTATQLCVKIKGTGVDTSSNNDVDCLNLGTGNDDVGDTNCDDPPTTVAPDDPTGLTGTTDADGTTKESDSGAVTAYLNLSLLIILVLATQTLIGN
ncbi:uncharacterized protein [Ptychodera flava]|uniref:uncharacterized protein n=1 Tax=Ptychodera flava TaxID=63121 RepID=UPI00396A956B